MKNLIIILTLFLFTPLMFGQPKENCYVVVESSEEFNPTFLTNISAMETSMSEIGRMGH